MLCWFNNYLWRCEYRCIKARTQEENIKKKMLADSKNLKTALVEGTFQYDSLSANSIEVAKTEVEIEQVDKMGFVETSWGEQFNKKKQKNLV